MKKQKTVKPISEKTNTLPFVEDVSVLLHILSPLELSAWKNNYQAFTYNFDGIPISINLKECKVILVGSKKRIDAFKTIIHKTNQKLVNENVSQKRNFTETLITEHDLPVQGIRTLQTKLGCKTIYDVLRIGKDELILKQGISKLFMRKLEAVIAKNNCSHLF